VPKSYVKTIPDELFNNPNYSNFFDGKDKRLSATQIGGSRG